MLLKINKVRKTENVSANLFKNRLGIRQHFGSEDCVHFRNKAEGRTSSGPCHTKAGTQSYEAGITAV